MTNAGGLSNMSINENKNSGKEKKQGGKTYPFISDNSDITFDHVGGLKNQLQTIKDLIIFPFSQEHIYRQYNIKPPRGVIFYGPPGTGKTLVARALANECNKILSQKGKKVTFFYKNGADFLDKWFGESESKLRVFFEEAKNHSPAIIFIDELDGLAPKRSNLNDHTHTSIVATLLSLMDGLEEMNGVFVIAATNRLEAIDPALRRTGRFDRELHFPLPSFKGRLEILKVHVQSWPLKPKEKLLLHLSEMTSGFCGSDLQALCSEAAMAFFRRQMTTNKRSVRIEQSFKTLKIEERDFMEGYNKITPSALRNGIFLRQLNKRVQPLLQGQLNKVLSSIQIQFPHFFKTNYTYEINQKYYGGRILLLGDPAQGHHNHLAPAILHSLEHLPNFVYDVNSICEQGLHCAEEICLQKFKNAKLNSPSVLVLHRVDECWKFISDGLFVTMLEDLDEGLPILVLATATRMPDKLRPYFHARSCVILNMENPTVRERKQFLYPLFMKHLYRKCFPQKAVKNGESISEDDFNRKRKESPTPSMQQGKKLRFDNSVSCCKYGSCSRTTLKSSQKKLDVRGSKMLRQKLSGLNEKEKLLFGKITDLYCQCVTLTNNKNVTQLNLLYDILDKIVNAMSTPFEVVQRIERAIKQMNG